MNKILIRNLLYIYSVFVYIYIYMLIQNINFWYSYDKLLQRIVHNIYYLNIKLL